MKYTIFFLLIALMFFCPQEKLYAGKNTDIDSLLSLLPKADEIEKLRLFNEIAEQYIPQNPDKSYEYAQKALKNARAQNNKIAEADALNNMGKAWYFKRSKTKAVNYFNQSYDLSEKIEYTKGKAKALTNLALLNKIDKNYENAAEYLLRAIDENKKLEDMEEMARLSNDLASVFYHSDKREKALEYYNKALQINKKLNHIAEIAISYNRIGKIHYSWSDYKTAIANYEKALKIWQNEDNKEQTASVLINIGLCYQNQGDFDRAFTHFQQALSIAQKGDYRELMGQAFDKIAQIHSAWGKYQKALEYFDKALELHKQNNNDEAYLWTLGNIATTYKYQNKYDKALQKYKEVLKEHKKNLDYKDKIATTLANIGEIYVYINEPENAIAYFDEALELQKQVGDIKGRAKTLYQTGKALSKMGKMPKALDYFNQSLELAKLMGAKELEAGNYLQISENLALLGDFKNSLGFYKLYTTVKDSIFSEESHERFAELETRYQMREKQMKIELLNKEGEIKDAEIRKKQFVIYAFVIGLLVVIGFSIGLFRLFRQKKKAYDQLEIKNQQITEQRDKIEKQKEEIEQQRDYVIKQRDQIQKQKKDITDSIQYASRIQNAVMPPKEIIGKVIPKHFILFKPRDIVSGDFYWFKQAEIDGKKYYAITAADCTGHGVPGAFMSMLGVSLLNEIVNKTIFTKPDEILNNLRKKVIFSLHQTGKFGEPQDGMDIAFSIIDIENMRLYFSGANNPLYFIRDNELTTYKSDRMPIGIHRKGDRQFTAHTINLQKNDTFYMFSDGYIDQFGGERGKKFLSKNFKRLLSSIQDKPMSQQKVILDNTIESWMADYQQIDDILVIGIRM